VVSESAVSAVDVRREGRNRGAPAGPRDSGPLSRRRRFLRTAGQQLVLWLVVLGAWQLVSGGSKTLEQSLGSPTGVLRQLGDLARSDGWSQVLTTGRTAFYGYVLGILLAIAATAVLVPFKIVMRFLDPFLMVLNAIPRVSIAPVFIVCFGIGTKTGVVFVVSIIFLMVFMNLYAGVKSIDPTYSMNITALGGLRIALLRQVYAPAVLGWLMTSLRTSAAWALLGAALAEYLAGNGGLGYLLSQGGTLANPNLVAAAATLIALMAVASAAILGIVERRFSQWRVF
jgi:NitT/TauT family transport system permease protein